MMIFKNVTLKNKFKGLFKTKKAMRAYPVRTPFLERT